jgi:hypothetical protein
MFQRPCHDLYRSFSSQRGHQPLAALIVRRSSQQFNALHIVMARKAGVSVIPFDLDVSRVVLSDRATIHFVAVEANECADF